MIYYAVIYSDGRTIRCSEVEVRKGIALYHRHLQAGLYRFYRYGSFGLDTCADQIGVEWISVVDPLWRPCGERGVALLKIDMLVAVLRGELHI